MLYEFLKNNYKEAEPIFFSDIVIEGITKSAVNPVSYTHLVWQNIFHGICFSKNHIMQQPEMNLKKTRIP